MCAMTGSYVCYDFCLCVPWLSHMCAMTPSYEWHDSSIGVPWLFPMCATTRSYVCHDSCIFLACRIHVWAMSYSYVCRDSFIRVISFERVTWLKVCEPWLIHLIIHLTQSHVTWIIHMWMIHSYVHSYVWHEPFTWDMIHLFICDVAHSYVARIIHVCIDSLTCDISLHYIWMDSYDSFIHELSHSLWHISPIYGLTHMIHSYTDWLNHMW